MPDALATLHHNLTAAQKAALEKKLPRDFSIENLRFVTARAVVKPMDVAELDDTQTALYKADVERGGPPMITNDLPTTLAVVAWMCHEGMNDNGQGFVAEELKIAAKQVSVRNQLIMDWNHAAVLGFTDDPPVIGTWYAADYAFDPKAVGGKGAWGILLTGMMWAWKFAEQANSMLADQERGTGVQFSMACIAKSVEYMRDPVRGYGEILHNPVFFTNTGLNVPPADKDAVGAIAEGGAPETDALRLRLNPQMALNVNTSQTAQIHTSGYVQVYPQNTTTTTTTTWPGPWWIPNTTAGTVWIDAQGNPITITTTTTAIPAVASKEPTMPQPKTPETPAVVAEEVFKETIIVEVHPDEEIDGNKEQDIVLSATELLAAAEAEVAKLTLQRDTAHGELTAAQAAIEALNAAFEAMKAKLDALETFKREGDKALLISSRVAALPETMQAALGKNDNVRKRVEEKAAASEDIWTAYREELLVGHSVAPKIDYVARTEAAGGALPTGAEPAASGKLDFAKIRS